jgi:homoserine kinase
MSDKLPDDIRAKLVPGFADLSQQDETKECAYIGLRGATERLLMVLNYRSENNYETAMKSVERAMTEYREVVGGMR